MAAKGNQSKELIIAKLKECFPDAFMVDGKELRIPLMEEGSEVQIKVALTCAKDNIPHAGSDSAPAAPVTSSELTAEEKNEVIGLINRLGL